MSAADVAIIPFELLPGEDKRQIERYRATNWSTLDTEARAFVFLWVEGGHSTAYVMHALAMTSGEVRKMRMNPIVQACVHDMVVDHEVSTAAMVAEMNQIASEITDIGMAREEMYHVVDGMVVFGKKHDMRAALAAQEFKAKINKVVSVEKQSVSPVTVNLNFGSVSARPSVIIDQEPEVVEQIGND